MPRSLSAVSRSQPSDGIAQARATLDYAKGHIDQLVSEIKAWPTVEPKPYVIVGHIDLKTRQQVFRFLVVRDPPTEWGHRMRGISNDLRSALNYAIRACADPLTDIVGFPIYRSERDYWEVPKPKAGTRRRGKANLSPRDRYLVNVPELVRKVVDARQPYHGGDAAFAHPLAVLSDLTNVSKHGEVGPVVMLALSQFVRVDAMPPGRILSARLITPGTRLHDNMEIARILAADPPKTEATLHGTVSIDIALGKPGLLARSVPTIRKHVLEIVEDLDAARRET